jgi:quercetin dioxygenase-like cupin family protein
MSEEMNRQVQVLSLNEVVAYQDATIVSKTLVDKKVGTMTVFAFAQGQGLSEHTVPFDAVVQVIDGEAQVTIAGSEYRVGSGQLIIMPANQPHSIRAELPFKMVLVMIRT